MQSYAGLYYTGMRLFDRNGDLINVGVWDRGISYESTEWIEQEVPDGQHIIGFKCTPVYDQSVIVHLSFILADTGLGTISGELNFPPVKEYPDRHELGNLY